MVEVVPAGGGPMTGLEVSAQGFYSEKPSSSFVFFCGVTEQRPPPSGSVTDRWRHAAAAVGFAFPLESLAVVSRQRSGDRTGSESSQQVLEVWTGPRGGTRNLHQRAASANIKDGKEVQAEALITKFFIDRKNLDEDLKLRFRNPDPRRHPLELTGTTAEPAGMGTTGGGLVAPLGPTEFCVPC